MSAPADRVVASAAEARASMRELLTGNEAIARGAFEAGVHMVTGYPGTPSTEIIEALARLPETIVQWSANEKVALDTALGAALGGARALCTMKHVGVNVAADTLMTAAYTGVGGALVVVSADDPGMHSSQNEQDNRLYARFAGVPMLEPADAEEARLFTRWAFELSARYDVPVLLRTTTRIAHTRTVVQPQQREAAPPTGFVPNPPKYVMLPAYARTRHAVVLERLARLGADSDPRVARAELREPQVGVITSGVVYHYVREILPRASVLKLNRTHPLPLPAVRAFAAQVHRLLVVEELEPFLEEQLRAAGLSVEGKVFWPRVGELTPARVRAGFAAAGILPAADPAPAREVMPRPPVLCPGCPHVLPLLALRKLGAVICGDIGCYTLAALPPLLAMDTCVAMGCSIGMAAGLARAGHGGPVAAAIGDSTFLHAGIPALLDAVYNRARIVVLILNNGTTAMTGGQPHPGTGQDARGEAAPAVDLAALCRTLGASFVATVDPYDLAATYRAVEEAIAFDGPAVLITNRPCVEAPVKIRDVPYIVIPASCIACQLCMNLGCPAIAWSDEWHEGRLKVAIDASQCTGCTVCAQLCPTDAIRPVTARAERA